MAKFQIPRNPYESSQITYADAAELQTIYEKFPKDSVVTSKEELLEWVQKVYKDAHNYEHHPPDDIQKIIEDSLNDNATADARINPPQNKVILECFKKKGGVEKFLDFISQTKFREYVKSISIEGKSPSALSGTYIPPYQYDAHVEKVQKLGYNSNQAKWLVYDYVRTITGDDNCVRVDATDYAQTVEKLNEKTKEAENYKRKLENELKAAQNAQTKLANELKATQDAQTKLANELKVAQDRKTEADKAHADAMQLMNKLEKEKTAVADTVAKHEKKRLEAEAARDKAIEERDNAVTIARKEVEEAEKERNIAIEERNDAVGAARVEMEKEFEEDRKQLDAEIAAATTARQMAEDDHKIALKKTKEAEDKIIFATDKQVAAEKSRRRVVIVASSIVAIAVLLSACFLYLSATSVNTAAVANKELAEYIEKFDKDLAEAVESGTAMAAESAQKAEEKAADVTQKAEEREAEAAKAIDASVVAHQEAKELHEAASQAFANAMKKQEEVDEAHKQLLKEKETVTNALEAAESEKRKALDDQQIAQDAKEKADAKMVDAQAKIKKAEEMMRNLENGQPKPVVNPINDPRLGVTITVNNGDGVLITDVTNDSAAHQAGLESGDTIHRLDDKPLALLQDYLDAIDVAGERIRLHVLKADGTTRRIITLVLPDG